MLSAAQFRLLKLAEECSEVVKECSKLMIGGPNNVYEGKPTRELLEEEILDVLVCIRLLQKAGLITTFTTGSVKAHFLAKRDKIVRRTHEHIAAGTVDQDILNYIPETL